MSHPALATLAPPDYNGHFVMIPLTKGKFAIVDEADAGLVLSAGRWCAASRRRLFYAVRSEYGTGGSRTILMHALITGYKMTDHVNRNGLDNRRINLREATYTQNNANTGLSRQNTSGYKGVSWDRESSKWMAVIRNGDGLRNLGRFADPVEAARAYNRAALEAWGEFAWLNPVQTPCGTGWGAGKRAARQVPVVPRGIAGVVLRTLTALGGEATTGEICRDIAREDSPLRGSRVRNILDDFAARQVPLVEETERGHRGRGASSRWRITPEGRAVVAVGEPCSVGWPMAS